MNADVFLTTQLAVLEAEVITLASTPPRTRTRRAYAELAMSAIATSRWMLEERRPEEALIGYAIAYGHLNRARRVRRPERPEMRSLCSLPPHPSG